MKLVDHANAQCDVRIYPNGDIVFWSYETPVIYVECVGYNEHRIRCTGTYSSTTRRQIGWFLREFYPQFDYQTMKALAEQQVGIIIETGEVVGL